MANKKQPPAPKAPKGKSRKDRWKCSLSKGASYTNGEKTYHAGKSYLVSKEMKDSLQASGMFYCQPAK